MKSSSILFFLLFSCIFFQVKAQNNFKEAFIINLENDTLKGLINSRSEFKNYNSCQFKRNGELTTYQPNQIHGFGFQQGKFYSAEIIKRKFVETLVFGDLSLYKYKSQYFLKKEGKTYKLQPKDNEVNYRGKKAVYEDKKC
ncbi:hypothetical protein QWY93_05560 [Echinicola jeungdonensis]|uniref:Uncharacterized protein n=1 Tax=Echinicola jeungdonensis TaxID=709343 RepID=A0ABV5J2H2_9BACT|nr:hypothetical protein [Echinicola jeungdonensis]MDN3668791.1 hypothetical protein [Echinicola jeungdonensis]